MQYMCTLQRLKFDQSLLACYKEKHRCALLDTIACYHDVHTHTYTVPMVTVWEFNITTYHLFT